MNTATFTDKNSYTDFGLILAYKEIGEAEVRTNYIDVPARDGLLDATEAFGEVKYKNRPITIELQYIGADKDWAATLSAFTNYIHGKKHKIFFEREYYWYGRCKVKPASSSGVIRTITVECDCEPYKLKVQDTVVNVTVENERYIANILNDRKTVTPFVTVLSGAPFLEWTDRKTGAAFSVALTGTNKYLDFKFYEGVNTFTVSGTGSVRFVYREGSL
jgi:hypothetical protein